jgi:SAM-dependent methyltransferase
MMHAILPFYDLLDPRPGEIAILEPIGKSVNIPSQELASRIGELPVKKKLLRVAKVLPWSDEAGMILSKAGRTFEITEGFDYICSPPGRLWQPNRFLQERMPSKPGRGLDLACGTGRDAVFLAANGWTVDAIDILPDALDRARNLAFRYLTETARVEFFEANLRKPLTLSQGAYDLVTCFYFFDETLLSSLASHLVSGGVLLFESFTESHRQKFGKPKGAQAAPANIAAILGGTVEYYEEAWRDDAHTVRVAIRY